MAQSNLNQSDNNRKPDNRFQGISLSTFLQMLEQDNRSCSLQISNGEREGAMFLSGGQLIDAEFDNLVGMDAVNKLMRTMKYPSLTVGKPVYRIPRINQSLAQILLSVTVQMDEEDYCKLEDEGDESGTPLPVVEERPAEKPKSLLQRLVAAISKIPAISQYYLLNRQTKVLAGSSKNKVLCDFIAYAVLNGLQIGKASDLKGLLEIRMPMDDGQTLVILPRTGLHIGLVLDKTASVSATIIRIQHILRSLQE